MGDVSKMTVSPTANCVQNTAPLSEMSGAVAVQDAKSIPTVPTYTDANLKILDCFQPLSSCSVAVPMGEGNTKFGDGRRYRMEKGEREKGEWRMSAMSQPGRLRCPRLPSQ